MAGEMATLAGQRMRARREELKLTQPAVAERIKALVPHLAVDKQRVSDWERGVNFPSDAYKAAIATALEVDDQGGFSYFLRSETPSRNVLDMSSEDARVRLERIDRKLDQVLAALGVTSRAEGAGGLEDLDADIQSTDPDSTDRDASEEDLPGQP